MNILVLGAGVVGVTSAWYLAQAGHTVTVVDRQLGAGLETSFANGGQISVSHAEPWANPQALLKLLKWLGKEDAPLLVRLRADPALARWGLAFLAQCTTAHTRFNVGATVRLALHSRDHLQRLRAQTGIRYDHLERGILHIYTDPKEFSGAVKAAALMREFGLDRNTISAAQCVEIEPALAAVGGQIVGGDWTPSDESGDAHLFTRNLATLAAERGVRFRYGSTVEALEIQGGRVVAVRLAGAERLTADAVVVALGSHTPRFLEGLEGAMGVRPNIYPAKGYSATIPLGPGSVAPSVSVTDDGHKIVFSRLGDRLRVAGTAEFNGYNLSLSEVRCQALWARTRALFPELAPAGEPQFWCGLRPATPSNLPYIGPTRISNLYLNSGHGTLGWTLACGSGAALAALVEGRQPEPDFPFLGS